MKYNFFNPLFSSNTTNEFVLNENLGIVSISVLDHQIWLIDFEDSFYDCPSNTNKVAEHLSWPPLCEGQLTTE